MSEGSPHLQSTWHETGTLYAILLPPISYVIREQFCEVEITPVFFFTEEDLESRDV